MSNVGRRSIGRYSEPGMIILGIRSHDHPGIKADPVRRFHDHRDKLMG